MQAKYKLYKPFGNLFKCKRFNNTSLFTLFVIFYSFLFTGVTFAKESTHADVHFGHYHHHHHHASNKKIQALLDNPEKTKLGYQGLVVSNYPLYLLAKEATKGIENPKLLLPLGEVGHHYALKPSDRKYLQQAETIIWFGRTLEPALKNILANKDNAVELLELVRTQKPLQKRNEKGNLEDIKKTFSEKPVQESLDPHIWLDPVKAKQIVVYIARKRAKKRPAYKKAYLANAKRFVQEVNAVLKEETANIKQLQAKQHVKKRYYISYHDAFQYLEKPLKLAYVGSLVTDPELPIKTSQILWLKKKKGNQTICIIGESKHHEKRLAHLKPYHFIVLDESMGNYDSYIKAWRGMSLDINNCFK